MRPKNRTFIHYKNFRINSVVSFDFRQFETVVDRETNYCLRCVEYSQKHEKIQKTCEQLLKENKRLKAQIKYLSEKEVGMQNIAGKANCQFCKKLLEPDELKKHLCMDY